MVGWDDDSNAASYADYARNWPTYGETSADLVRLASPEVGCTALDLACGTGATTIELLKRVGLNGSITGLDSSSAMLTQARSEITEPNVSFVVGPAERVAELVDPGVDSAVCNAAFWQLRAVPTLRGLRTLLSPGGSFAFNMPLELTPTIEDRSGTLKLNQLVAELAIQRGLEIPADTRPRRYSAAQEDVRRLLKVVGYELVEFCSISYTRSVDDVLAFCSIPVIADQLLPGADGRAKSELIAGLRDRLDPTARSTTVWNYFVGVVSDRR